MRDIERYTVKTKHLYPIHSLLESEDVTTCSSCEAVVRLEDYILLEKELKRLQEQNDLIGRGYRVLENKLKENLFSQRTYTGTKIDEAPICTWKWNDRTNEYDTSCNHSVCYPKMALPNKCVHCMKEVGG